MSDEVLGTPPVEVEVTPPSEPVVAPVETPVNGIVDVGVGVEDGAIGEPGIPDPPAPAPPTMEDIVRRQQEIIERLTAQQAPPPPVPEVPAAPTPEQVAAQQQAQTEQWQREAVDLGVDAPTYVLMKQQEQRLMAMLAPSIAPAAEQRLAADLQAAGITAVTAAEAAQVFTTENGMTLADYLQVADPAQRAQIARQAARIAAGEKALRGEFAPKPTPAPAPAPRQPDALSQTRVSLAETRTDPITNHPEYAAQVAAAQKLGFDLEAAQNVARRAISKVYGISVA